MKLLLNNIILDATITSLNGSLNYPPENIQDSVLAKRFQSSIDQDVLTCDFESQSSVNCFYYSFTNASTIQVRFFIGSDTLVYAFTISSPEDTGAYHFNTIVADFMEIVIIGGLGVYIGGCATGLDVSFPNPVSPWNENVEDNSIVSENRAGETQTESIESLDVYSWIFRENSREEVNYYKNLLETVGLGTLIWVDPFEQDHDFISPLYAKLTNPVKISKDGRNYRFNLDIKQAR
jgi:hypothetical protein